MRYFLDHWLPPILNGAVCYWLGWRAAKRDSRRELRTHRR